jgi:hypothetical protein
MYSDSRLGNSFQDGSTNPKSAVKKRPKGAYLALCTSKQAVQSRSATTLGRLICFYISEFFFFFETGSCYVAQPGLEPVIILPQSLECWVYGWAPLLG